MKLTWWSDEPSSPCDCLISILRRQRSRMSKKQWLVLLMLFLAYLLLGASIFYYIESHLENDRINKTIQERIEINGKNDNDSCFCIDYPAKIASSLIHQEIITSTRLFAQLHRCITWWGTTNRPSRHVSFSFYQSIFENQLFSNENVSSQYFSYTWLWKLCEEFFKKLSKYNF